MASSLSPAERVDIAVFLSQLEAPYPTPQQIEKDMRDLGHDLAVNGRPERGINRCDGCHGPNGLGIAPHFPALIAQNRGYLMGQFEAWRDGKRRNSLLELMLPVVHGIEEQELWAVAAYYETVRP